VKQWKLTWGYVPITYDTELGVLENVTQHVVIKNNLNGEKIRLKFTNIGNNSELIMEKVVVCKRNRLTGILSDGVTITRNNKEKIILKPDEECWSDEIKWNVLAIDDLEIFTYFKEKTVVKTACLTWSTEIWNSNLYEGDVQEGKKLDYKDVFPFLGSNIYSGRCLVGFSRVALYSDADVKTVALFGDSITHMSYYSDPLTKMLYRRLPGQVTVINGGIGGNRLIADAPYVEAMPGHGKLFGKAGIERFEKDIYEDTTPDIIFCMEGVNDCTHSFVFKEDKIPTGEDLWNGLEKIINIAHSKGSKVYISTVMPFGCYNEPFREAAEQIRQDFNARIRSQNSADGLIDLDELMRKEDDIHFMKDGMHFGDGVHPNAEGGKVIASALLLKILGESMDFRKEQHLAIPLFENPIDYPVETLADMVRLVFKIRDCKDPAEKEKMQHKFVELRNMLQNTYEVKAPVYLWPDGKIPGFNEYTHNDDYEYAHDPDFKPYLLEVLLPENIKPKGAMITIAGGEHGMNVVSECYQICKNFNDRGYQCFILVGRPNRRPWKGQECGVDVARAIRYVRANAEKYRIKENQIALTGFSNGGIAIEQCIQYYSGKQQVKDIFTDYEPDELDKYSATPDAQICVYGPRHKGTKFDYTNVVYPPTFFAVGRMDYAAIENLNAVYFDLCQRKIPVEIHTFSGHPHGYAGWKIIDGKGNQNFDLWEPLADHFIQDVFAKNGY